MKKMLLSIVAGLALIAIPVSTVSASGYWWPSGKGQCQPDGSFQITWKIENHKDKILTVKESNRAIVPVGSTVAAWQTAEFTESVDGTQDGWYKLTTKASWPSNQGLAEKDAFVWLGKACKQPPTLTVKKTTSPVGNQTLFSITATTENGQVYGEATQNIKDGGVVIYKVAPGTYTVVETAVDGWTQTSNTCKEVVIDSEEANRVFGVEHEDGQDVSKKCAIVNTKNAATPQVLGTTTQVKKAPTGSVSAGSGGGSSTTSLAAILGTVSSLGFIGYGLRRLNKSEL